MRVAQIIAAVALVLMLLTWLWLSSTNNEAGTADEAMRALDDFSMAERALHRDVLSARIGLLRNYDPLVREINALRDATQRLRAAAAREPEIAAAANRLAAQIHQQEQWTERFKTRNALLQNSLSHFALLSAQLSAADQGGARARRVGALATALMELTFDPSPAVAAQVDARLAGLPGDPPPGDDPVLERLLAHAHLLRKLLPEIDGAVRAVFVIPRNGEAEVIRALILARKNVAEKQARSFRHILYVTSLLLLGSLAYLGIRLQSRARSLRRRAAMEHVIASISTRFINSRPRDIAAHVALALGELAAHMGAARAYFIAGGKTVQLYKWSRDGVSFPRGWPESTLPLAGRFARKDREAVHIHDVRKLEPGEESAALLAAGLHGWLFIPSRGGRYPSAVLGFDTLQPGPIARPGDLSLLRMACDAITNAVARESLERDRERLEANLQHARRMETLGALTSGIAHNFNNIIGAISGYAETAQAYVEPGRRPMESLIEIRRAAERARDLVGQILTFGRGGARRSTLVCVKSLVSEAKSLLDASLGADVRIVVRTTSELAMVRGTPAQLQQVILNVCKNAAQALEAPGAIEVETGVHELALPLQTNTGELPPGRYTVIAVTDAGRGMDETTQERMFEPFFSSRLEGNGLGLATVREIVLQHAGAVKVRSAPGAGTCFEVWLPCAPDERALPGNGGGVSGRGAGETVLVLEPDRERLLRHEEILAALGYEPVGFAHSAEALGAVRTAPARFDAALLCCHLHGVELVLDLAGELRGTAPDLPLILATASASDFGAPSLAGAGIATIIRQPLTSGELADALATVCYGRSVFGQETAA